MTNTELETIRTKAQSLRSRNNRLEGLVSSIHPDASSPANSVLIRELPTEARVEIWREAMTELANQFEEIQELIGMTR